MKSLKGTLILLLILVILAAGLVYYSTPSTAITPTLEISRLYGTQLQPGQTINVTISIKNVTDFSSMIVSLAWDPYVLAVTTGDPQGLLNQFTGTRYNIYMGSFLKEFSNSTQILMIDNSNENGTIKNLYTGIMSQSESAAGSGVLAIINFTCIHSGITTIDVVGPTNGTARLSDVGKNQINHIEVDGIITNAPPPPVWTETGFQIPVISIEIIVLTVLSLAIFLRKRVIRRRAVAKEIGEEEIKL